MRIDRRRMKKAEEQQRDVKRALTPREVAHRYGLSEGSLANARSKKQGCRFYRVPPGGRKIVYFVDDIEKWLRKNPVLTRDHMTENE